MALAGKSIWTVHRISSLIKLIFIVDLEGCTSVDKITKDYVAAAEDYSFSKTLSRL